MSEGFWRTKLIEDVLSPVCIGSDYTIVYHGFATACAFTKLHGKKSVNASSWKGQHVGQLSFP
jgi:hypothetical protein